MQTQSQPLTSYDWQAAVLWPRHHCCQLGWTQNQHVQKATMGSHHQHRSLLQVCSATLDLDPQETHGEEDGSAQQPHNRVKEPEAPALDRSRAFLLRQAGQSKPGKWPYHEKKNGCEGNSKGKEDAAQDDALWIRCKTMKYNFSVNALLYCPILYCPMGHPWRVKKPTEYMKNKKTNNLILRKRASGWTCGLKQLQ